MITFTLKGDFKKTDAYFQKLLKASKLEMLEKYAQKGVEALRAATPTDSGVTADSWGYKIERNNGNASIAWTNTNINDGVNVAVILQYGHGTGTGGYVEGYDYINPAIRPIFDEIAEEIRKEVHA